MRKLWLLGLVGALALVVGPMVIAYAEEGAPGPKRERKAGDMPKGERPPEIILTPAQQEALQAPVAALQDALGKLKTKSIDVLGERDGKAFVLQTIRKALWTGEEGKARDREGKARGDRKPRGDADK
jgi:hypothetical protein